MGFDVYGKAPIAEVGEHFRTSVWAWRPLWAYCLAIAPEIAGKVKNAQYNDGDGLEADDARVLGEALASSVARGTAEACIEQFEEKIGGLPDKVCSYCDGTGIDTSTADNEECFRCDGTGRVRPIAAHYRFYLEPVEEFAAFCCASGGFEIW